MYKTAALLLVILALFFLIQPQKSPRHNPTTTSPTPSVTRTPAPTNPSYSVFIPYWQLPASTITLKAPTNTVGEPGESIYFALSPRADGTIQHDSAYRRIATFKQRAPQPHLLTIKMTQEDITTPILRNTKLQDKLIAESIAIAQKHEFDGILLDLEHSVLPFKEVRTSITEFTRSFSASARSNQLTFSMAIYGDTYYRARPYNIDELEPLVDTMYIMAYDFHKSYGTPGPNFPFDCANTYPYCFTRMIDDFLKDVPPHKLTIVYGLYGYTWRVDDQNRPITSGKARTHAQLVQPHQCPSPTCTRRVDPISHETTFSTSPETVTWYETPQSIEIKAAYAASRGITTSSFWAYGYYAH